jgi:hypothetical protein
VQLSHALLPVGPWPPAVAEPLTPYPLPTKDGGMLRTIGDARAYMLKLSEQRQWLDHGSPRIGYSYTERVLRR